MYYGRKKGIIIAIIVIVVVIVLAVIGLFLFLKTDLFKSNETLFYKYLGEHLETYKMSDNTLLQEIQTLKEQNPYIVDGELTVNYDENSGTSKTTQLLENLKLVVDGKYDKENEKENTTYKVVYGTQEIFRLDSAKTKDVYALKSDEIVQNAYLGLKNENLKVFLQKIGMQSQATQMLPDQLEDININEDLLKISDQEMQHIQETYSTIIVNATKESNYSKQNNVTITLDGQSYNCNSYRLDLTGEEVKSIINQILTELQQDSITLNLISTKAKTLGLSEELTEISTITKAIQNIKSELIGDLKFFDAGLSIVVYESDGKTIALESIIRNQQKYTIYNKVSGNTETLNIKIENLGVSADYKTINISIVQTKTSNQVYYQGNINIDEENNIILSYTSSGSVATNDVESEINLSISSNDFNLSGSYKEKVEFVDNINDIIELNNTNTAILNDYTKEQLDLFIPAVIQRIVEVFNEKLVILGIGGNNE